VSPPTEPPSEGPAAWRDATQQQDLHARDLLLRHGWNSTSYQIMNPDMQHWFSPDGEALVGYVQHFGLRVAAGAPVAEYGRLPLVAQRFEADAHRRGLITCYFGVELRWLELVGRRSAAVQVGAQPVWDAGDWAAAVEGHASLRAQFNRARNKGVRVERRRASALAPGQPIAHELRELRQVWAAAHGLPPLGFLTGMELWPRSAAPDSPFSSDRRLYVALQESRVVAYLVASPIPLRRGWLVEQVVRHPRAPNGASELLIDSAMRDLAAAGAGRLTLGLSPLSRRHSPDDGVRRDGPPWLRLAFAWARAHGRRFYDFAGLEAFKAKFRPRAWEPVYLVADGDRFGMRTLLAVAAAFTRGRPFTTLAQGVVRTFRR